MQVPSNTDHVILESWTLPVWVWALQPRRTDAPNHVRTDSFGVRPVILDTLTYRGDGMAWNAVQCATYLCILRISQQPCPAPCLLSRVRTR